MRKPGPLEAATKALAAALMLLAALNAPAASLDVDGDGTISADTDGQLILRHLFGYSGQTLVDGATAPEAQRNTAEIEAYLSGLQTSLDMDGDGRADALTDGILILRRLLGRFGDDLIAGATSADATRDADAISHQIDLMSTPPGQAPARVELVQANSPASDRIQLDWLPTFDNDTPGSRITYAMHVSETDGFVPGADSWRAEVVDNATGTIAGLSPATRYYLVVEARDEQGHRSWSNQLSAVTAEADPEPSAAPRQVLDAVSAPVTVLEPERIEVQLEAGTAAPAVDDLLVSDQGGGFLRRAVAVQQNGNSVEVATEPAALDEVFDNLSFSTELKLIDLPETVGPRDRAVGRGVIFQRSAGSLRATWPDSGLTIIERRPSVPGPRAAGGQPMPRASQDPVNCADADGRLQVLHNEKFKVTLPELVCVEPGKMLEVPVVAEVYTRYKDEYRITKLEFDELDGETKAQLNDYGAQFVAWPEDNGSRMTGTLRWFPQERHVDDKLRPYIATFDAAARQRDAYCEWYGCDDVPAKDDIEVKIGVSWGDLPEPQDTPFTLEGDIKLKGAAKVDFQPDLRTQGEISWGSLDFAEVVVEGPATLSVTLKMDAEGAARYTPDPQELYSRKFIKVFWAAQVPIIIQGELTVHLAFVAETDGEVHINEELELGYDLEAGIQYRGGEWALIRNTTPRKRFELTGEARARAYAEVRLIPRLDIAFYDVATGLISVEPYLDAEAALEGHFYYIERADGEGMEQRDDLDYRFTKLELGAGIQAKLRAGLQVFDKSLLDWPGDDSAVCDRYGAIDDGNCVFDLLARRPIIGLPTLVPFQFPTIPPAPEDSRAIHLMGGYADVPNPWLGLVSKPNSFNPFIESSAAWQVVLIDDGTRITPIPDSLGAWFSYTEPREYTLRFSGHSKLGSVFRQYNELTIDASDGDGDGMADIWEARWQVDLPNEDPDKDLYTNLMEFQLGLNPRVAELGDRDQDGMRDAWELHHQLDPDDPSDATENPDGDWLDNRAEHDLDTNPNRAEISLTLSPHQFPGPSGIWVFWQGRYYDDTYTLYTATEPFSAALTASVDDFMALENADISPLQAELNPTHGLDLHAVLVATRDNAPRSVSEPIEVQTAGKPSNVQGIPGDHSLTVTWDALPNNHAYRVLLWDSAPPNPYYPTTHTIDPATSPMTISDLEPGRTYYIGVDAQRNGYAGAVSDIVTAIAGGEVAPPAPVLQTAEGTGPGAVRVTWTFDLGDYSAPITGFVIQSTTTPADAQSWAEQARINDPAARQLSLNGLDEGEIWLAIVAVHNETVSVRSNAVLVDVHGSGWWHPNTTKMVSVSSAGTQGDKHATYPGDISADGRLVVFVSAASNLVANDNNEALDVFIHDRLHRTTERISVASDGLDSNGPSRDPTISADGRYIIYLSWATNLVPNDRNGNTADVYIHDLGTGATTIGSVSSSGAQTNSWGIAAYDISDDGRYLLFGARSGNFVSGDYNGTSDVFIRDMTTGETSCVSVTPFGWTGNAASNAAAMSADGRFVVFSSIATDLVLGDTNAQWDVFLRDRETATTRIVSRSSQGQLSNGRSSMPSISADGRFITYSTTATNIVGNDNNSASDVLLFNRDSGESVRITESQDGGSANADPYSSASAANISANGRFVAFSSSATDLIGGNLSPPQIYRFDRELGAIDLVSIGEDGALVEYFRFERPAIDATGSSIQFSAAQAFVRDLNVPSIPVGIQK